MPSNYTQQLFESVRTYVRITASIQSPKVRHAWDAGGTYECLNCTKLQVVAALTAQICKKNRHADVNQRSGCRGAETMVISLLSYIFPDKS